jgi:inhibitor of KinA sporulation pathway (predicted exonuclease)
MMATTINEATTIALLDGTEIEVRPLKISLLREFMKSFEKIAAVAEDNNKSMDLLLECVVIALKQYKPELAADAKALEDLLDLPTVYKIVEEASGIPMGMTSVLGVA